MNRRFSAVAACVLTAATVHAQQSGNLDASPSSATPAGAALDSPVTIAFERKTVRTLEDGTHINRTTHEWFYRDKEGRTRSEFETNSAVGGGATPRTSVIVTDPLAGETFSWISGAGMPQTYTVTKLVGLNPPAAKSASSQPSAMSPDPRPRPGTAAMIAELTTEERSGGHPSINREDLGTEEVQGAPCAASRTTSVYPINVLGNDRPITVVREVCTSRDFGRSLRERTNDPRTGVRTLTVASLSRSNPSQALFAPPPGYTERRSPLPPTVPSARGGAVNP